MCGFSKRARYATINQAVINVGCRAYTGPTQGLHRAYTGPTHGLYRVYTQTACLCMFLLLPIERFDRTIKVLPFILHDSVFFTMHIFILGLTYEFACCAHVVRMQNVQSMKSTAWLFG